MGVDYESEPRGNFLSAYLWGRAGFICARGRNRHDEYFCRLLLRPLPSPIVKHCRSGLLSGGAPCPPIKRHKPPTAPRNTRPCCTVQKQLFTDPESHRLRTAGVEAIAQDFLRLRRRNHQANPRLNGVLHVGLLPIHPSLIRTSPIILTKNWTDYRGAGQCVGRVQDALCSTQALRPFVPPYDCVGDILPLGA